MGLDGPFRVRLGLAVSGRHRVTLVLKRAALTVAAATLLATGATTQVSDTDVKITADNAYAFGWGDASTMLNYFGGVENTFFDAIFFCPHAAADNCDCRKPKPGMFTEISKRFEISLKGVPTVGDSLRDLQAGFISGCVPFLVLTGKGEKTHATGGLPPGTQVFPDLAAAVDHILKTE